MKNQKSDCGLELFEWPFCVCIYIYIYILGVAEKLWIIYYKNKRLYYKAKLILIKKKHQNKKIHKKNPVNLLNMVAIFSMIVSTHLRNDVHAFKINSLDILFYSSSIAILSEPIFG